MIVYVAREDATAYDLQDIILGVFSTKPQAIQACQDQILVWQDSYDYDSDSGWINYNELMEGGDTRELAFDDVAMLIYKVYECEVQDA